MPASNALKLQNHLKRALRALDTEISTEISATPLDTNLQRAFSEMYVHRDDELGRLLAEVAQKAGLLGSARARAAFRARHPAQEGETYSCQIVIEEQEPRQDGLDKDAPSDS